MRQVIYFAVAGGIGFIVDSGVFLYLYYIQALDMIISRILSFATAVFATWILNRTFTFESKNKMKKAKEYILYFKIQTIGALINFAVFLGLVYTVSLFEQIPLLAIAAGSICAMFYNFIMSKKLLEG